MLGTTFMKELTIGQEILGWRDYDGKSVLIPTRFTSAPQVSQRFCLQYLDKFLSSVLA